MRQTGSATKNGASGHIEVFQYLTGPDAPPLPMWEGWGAPAAAEEKAIEAPAEDHIRAAAEVKMLAAFDKRLAEETRRGFEAGREQGKQEGRQAERQTHADALSAASQERQRQAVALIEGFAQARDRFLENVENEVVELALAVAARILRREAQMDPLLLTGAVRVALGQLSRSTNVKLRIPPAELDLWTEAMALVPNLAIKPTIQAEEGMRLGDCVVETELGSVDLGIRAQLGEIERGFFDRAAGSRNEPQSAAAGAGRQARL
ncbi:MAG: FliH/SctL family protein [Terracidiphilus sp.]